MNVRPGVVMATSPVAVNVDGALYSAPWKPMGYTPALNDRVRVLLCAGETEILSVISSPGVGMAVAPAPAAPAVSSSGTLHMPAVQSGSYRNADGWGSSSSRPLSVNAVVQGTAPGSSYAYSGSWFFGSQVNQIAGAAFDSARMRIGPRLEIGANNSPLTLHVYAHTSSTKPGGDVTRVAGPYDFTVAAHHAGGWIGTLPSGVHATIAAGGGISVTGSPYLGMAGLDVDPASGQLDIDWHR